MLTILNNFFDTKNMIRKIQSHFPYGRVYHNIYNEKSNFYKLIKFLASCFEWFINKVLNEKFKGFYIVESDYSLDILRLTYRIPNDIFYIDDENIIDIFVLKYLARDNTALGIQKIFNAYGIRARVYSVVGEPFNIYIKLYTKLGDRFFKSPSGNVGYKLPIYFTTKRRREKLIKFLETIKPVNSIIISFLANEEEIKNYKSDPEEPDFIKFTINKKETEFIIN